MSDPIPQTTSIPPARFSLEAMMDQHGEGKAIKPFDQILRDMNGGRLIEELTDELTEVVEATRLTGKKGSVTLTLDLKPRGDSNMQLEVIPRIKGVKPEQSRPISIFYINNDHGLQRNDPRQNEMPFGAAAEPEQRSKSA